MNKIKEQMRRINAYSSKCSCRCRYDADVGVDVEVAVHVYVVDPVSMKVESVTWWVFGTLVC